MAASKELSLELDKEAMRTLVQAQKNVILSDMNTALSDTCKRVREENAEKDREIISLKLKNERANQRLKQATAPGIAPSAPDAEEARLPLGVGRGQLINMMGAAASKPAPGAPSSFRSKRCARPCLPDIELEHANQRLKQATAPGIAPSAPVPMNDHPVPVPPYDWPPRASTVAASKELSLELDKEAMRSLVQAQQNVLLLDMNAALSDKCKQFREENAEKDREIISLKLKNERANQRLIQATAPEAHMF
ncbi:MAG: hypothetical protein QF618_07115, partial [SAR324 cluster bacterium]|nr:hypothetical protein [SAR324 cluster bacterium]